MEDNPYGVPKIANATMRDVKSRADEARVSAPPTRTERIFAAGLDLAFLTIGFVISIGLADAWRENPLPNMPFYIRGAQITDTFFLLFCVTPYLFFMRGGATPGMRFMKLRINGNPGVAALFMLIARNLGFLPLVVMLTLEFFQVNPLRGKSDGMITLILIGPIALQACLGLSLLLPGGLSLQDRLTGTRIIRR